MLSQGFLCSGRLHLVNVGISVLNAPVGCDQSRRRLLPNAWNTGNVVRGVAHQSLHIHKFLRCHLILFLHVGRIVVLNLRASSGGFGHPDLHMFVRQLQQIPIS